MLIKVKPEPSPGNRTCSIYKPLLGCDFNEYRQTRRHATSHLINIADVRLINVYTFKMFLL